MISITWVIFLSHLLALSVLASSLIEFNDQLMYDISWNGPLTEQAEEKNNLEKVIITTKHKEKYQCLIPKVHEESEDAFDVENGASPEALLSDTLIGTPRKCSYRLEPYWTYEVCHGKSVTQYHEEKDKDGKIKRDEYILGLMTDEEIKDIMEGPKPIEAQTGEKRKIKTKRIEGKDTPYYSVTMGNGTPCDLNGKLRTSSVLYVCHLAANNEVISVKEVTSCEYEIIVLSSVICANPAFTIKDDPVNAIQCHAFPGYPSRPISLMEQSNENVVIRSAPLTQAKTVRERKGVKKVAKPYNDEQLNKQFLSGQYCLIGGSGWWNYEFCNGKYVQQFHQETKKPKVTINLGNWNKAAHLRMVKSGAIVPKGKKHVMHYYSDGDICDLTGQPRSAIVILTCVEGTGQQLAIYMSESKPCEYTIGVESPILCPFVQAADVNGLF